MSLFLLLLPPTLTYEPGTGWITTYSTIAGEHLQALPESPDRVRINKKGAWLRIASPIDLIVGEQIIICAGQPILQCAIITPWIPSSYGYVAKDRRMRKVKLGLGDDLQSLIVNRIDRSLQLRNLLGNSPHVLWFCCQHPLRVLALGRDWISWRCRVCLCVCEITERNNTSDMHCNKFYTYSYL